VGRTLVANTLLAGSACGKQQRGRPLNAIVRRHQMSSARDWIIPTAVCGVVLLVTAVILGGFLGDFLFSDACLDRGGMVDGAKCIGADVASMGAGPYAFAASIALLVTLGVGLSLWRISRRGVKRDDV
jgi:hypothetical protein